MGNGEWVYGSLIIDEHDNCYIGEYIPRQTNITTVGSRQIGKTLQRFCAIGFYMVIPETVGQYTGLQNKNGTKIFEGDIVSAESNKAWRTGLTGEVMWEYGMFRIENKMLEVSDSFMPYDTFEIKGNIHDNPKLCANKKG